MFNIGWGEMLVLVVIGLVVLGPERLPGAIRWTADALRQAREYITGATSNLREELGPEFDDLREPLSELQKLRGMTPRQALTKHLLDGDDSVFRAFDRPVDLPPDTPPTAPPPTQAQTPQSADGTTSGGPGEATPGGPGGATPGGPGGATPGGPGGATPGGPGGARPGGPGASTPFDSDAT